jgi:hypothetical protein
LLKLCRDKSKPKVAFLTREEPARRIDAQGIALVLLMAVLGLVLLIAALWIGLR